MSHRFLHLPVIFTALFCVVSMAGPAVALVPDEPSVASNGTPRAGAFSAFQKPVLRLAGRSERKKRKSRDKKDKRKDEGVAPVSESCAECAELDGFVSSSEIDDIIRKMVGKYRGGVASDNVAIQQARGVIETGLKPEFIGGADCPEIDSEKWAIDYSYKRGKAALHKGIDIPQPRGTPIRVIADGVVVGRFLNDDNKKGIEVMVRHTPEQTGLTFWIYSQYTHLREMSPLPIGARVKMGDEIGKTSNTGVMGKRERRDALHFAILYSVHPEWSNDGEVVTPKDGYFMDPNAFYRHSPPYDSPSLLSLPGDQKNVPVPYMKAADTFLPPDTKRIWPYLCE